MQRPAPKQHAQAVVATVAVFAAVISVLTVSVGADDAEPMQNLLRRVIDQTTRTGIAARSMRHLQAGTVSGKHQATMKVETVLTSGGTFSWNVIEETGSERTREKVFRAILDAEAETWKAGAHDRAALSPANYIFVPQGLGRTGLTTIRVRPRRAESNLIDGTLTVDSEGYPVLLEGRLAKSPSFWVNSVTVIRRYRRIDGVALPVSVESLADVKMVGKSSFAMRYAYREVNGRSVAHATALTAAIGPSSEMLAAYQANRFQNR